MSYSEAELTKMLRENPQLIVEGDIAPRPAIKAVQSKPSAKLSEYRLTLPYPTSANRYWRNVRGRMVRSAEATAYKKHIGRLCMAAGIEPLTGNVRLVLDLYRPQRSGDLDNFLKVLGDALIGWAYIDDKQIIEIHARRFDDKDNPRVEVTVESAA